MMPGRSLLLAAALLAAALGAAEADQSKLLKFLGMAPLVEPIRVSALRFLGATTIPNDAKIGGVPVGGLSGLDYDPRSGMWVVISDDKSEHGPARFYPADIELGEGVLKVKLSHQATLGQENGALFPDAETGGEVVDPESIRFDPSGRAVWWTSEGDRKLGLSPFLRKAELDGRYLHSFPLPPIFTMHQNQEIGPRNNNTFEGLAFTPDGSALWLAMESALYQDGPVATVEAGALARFTKFDRDGKLRAQFAYQIDPIQAKSAGEHSDNGVSEILALDEDRLLVLERSGVNDGNNHWTSHIRLYEASYRDINDATAPHADFVTDAESLAGLRIRPLSKRLVLNLDDLPQLGSAALPKIDNIEGMSFGPDLPNGHRSLVLVSDNNFNPDQITQFLAFEVLP
ncbi:esterase-like activity of phytase family protein [Dongia sp. agr-C8]